MGREAAGRSIRDRSAWELPALRERTRMSALQLPRGGGFGKIQDAHGNAAGLPVSRPRSAHRPPCLNQPCTAWEGCRCRVYAGRPQYCHQFECALLKSGVAGRYLQTLFNIRQPTATIAPAIGSSRGNEALIFAGNRPCQSLVTSAATFLTGSCRASANRRISPTSPCIPPLYPL
jgi:hypothetical protein